jgi:hypothetical protein
MQSFVMFQLVVHINTGTEYYPTVLLYISQGPVSRVFRIKYFVNLHSINSLCMSVPFQTPGFLELDSNASGTHTAYIQDERSVFRNINTDISYYMLI